MADAAQQTLRDLEELGEHAVRLNLSAGSFRPGVRDAAVIWLAAKDHNRERRQEAMSLEDRKIARQARDAAIAAAIIAAISMAIAVCAVVMTGHG